MACESPRSVREVNKTLSLQSAHWGLFYVHYLYSSKQIKYYDLISKARGLGLRGLVQNKSMLFPPRQQL